MLHLEVNLMQPIFILDCVDLASNCADIKDQCDTDVTVRDQCFKTCTNCGQRGIYFYNCA